MMTQSRRHSPSPKRAPRPGRPRQRRTPVRAATPGLAQKREGGHVPESLTDAARGQRLQKVLAEAGVASRRECEALVASGRVTVNGQPVTALPAWVDPSTDRINLDGRPVIQPRPSTRRNHYVIVHKPRHVVSTCHDPQGRRCVTELVDLPMRLFPVGRLDADSSGLMLLTDDGELANRLTHPRYEVPKQYRVSVRGHVDDRALQDLREGICLAHLKQHPGGKAVQVRRASMALVKRIGFSRDQTRGDRTSLEVTLREGQNREIRRMLARLGYRVRRLERVALGPIQLKGLAVGQWRPLTGREIHLLRKVAGLGHAAIPGTQKSSRSQDHRRGKAAAPRGHAHRSSGPARGATTG